MSFVPLGLLSWLLMGLVTGVAGVFLLPGRPRLHAFTLAVLGVAGALLGGLVATVLGFGGVAGYDPRALVTATLGAVLTVLVFRLVRLPG
jgi:uncharacterized membrane protein YeaQ/YmgE (transglycosylase-associated protein family)